MHTAIRSLKSLALLLFCSQALATPQQLLGDLHQMRLAATNAVTNFYMFSGLDADSKYGLRIEQSTKVFSQALESAERLAKVNRMGDEVAVLSADWKRLETLITTNRTDMQTKGFPDVRLVDEMGRQGAEIVNKTSAAYNKLQEVSGIKPNPIIQKSRELALLMEEITSQYAARGTSNLGHVFMGNNDRTLNEMADDFQNQLDALNKLVKSPKTEVLMNSIQSKWRFMEVRIRNYNENTVPFLVVSYNDRIVEHFDELEKMFQ